MTHSSRLVARILVAIGGLASAGCDSSSSSVEGCGPPENNKACVSREKAWEATRYKRGSAGGAGGSGDTPATCPGNSDITSEYTFIEYLGLNGGAVTFTGAEGETCCYATSSICEGRPLFVEGVLRKAPLGRVADWG